MLLHQLNIQNYLFLCVVFTLLNIVTQSRPTLINNVTYIFAGFCFWLVDKVFANLTYRYVYISVRSIILCINKLT